jgi:hypothetical protein
MNRLATFAAAVALAMGAGVGIAACGGSDTTSTQVVTKPATGEATSAQTSTSPTSPTTTSPITTTSTTSATTTTSTSSGGLENNDPVPAEGGLQPHSQTPDSNGSSSVDANSPIDLGN